jgi:hypothetical protein
MSILTTPPTWQLFLISDRRQCAHSQIEPVRRRTRLGQPGAVGQGEAIKEAEK